MKTYYIKELLDSKCKNAMYKVRSDMIQIFYENGFMPIKTFYSYKYYNKNFIIKLLIQILSVLILLPKVFGKRFNIIIQYPNINGSLYFKFLSKILKTKAANIVILIHDFDSLRNIGDSKKDIQILELGNTFIVHNRVMKKMLIDKYKIDENKIFELNLFDYLTSFSTKDISKSVNKKVINVVFAGNLAKSKFLTELSKINNSNIYFQLFGVGLDKSILSDNVKYNGSFSSEELTEKICNYNFGLVWDGDSVDSCTGSYGEYLRINTPHKTSMCITSCLPVICWKESAIAQYITENNLGIAVSNLYELSEIFEFLTNEAYQKMIMSVKTEAENLRLGVNLKNILLRIGL